MSEETPIERAEAAATRRRWVTLAEVVAVAGVLIAALTLYNSWSDRRADEAERAHAASANATDQARVDLTASVVDGGRVLRLGDARHEIQDAVITFPSALKMATQRPAAEPDIDADAVAPALLKLTDGGPDEREGRMPVLVTVSYLDGDRQRSATAIYDILWKTEGRMLRGRTLKLTGFRLRERGGNQARVDALWKRDQPR